MPKLFQRFQNSPLRFPIFPYKNKSKSFPYPLISSSGKDIVGTGIDVIFAPIGGNYCVRELDYNKSRTRGRGAALAYHLRPQMMTHIGSIVGLQNPVKHAIFEGYPTQGKQELNQGGQAFLRLPAF